MVTSLKDKRIRQSGYVKNVVEEGKFWREFLDKYWEEKVFKLRDLRKSLKGQEQQDVQTRDRILTLLERKSSHGSRHPKLPRRFLHLFKPLDHLPTESGKFMRNLLLQNRNQH